MSSIAHLTEIFWFLVDPWMFMSLSASYIPQTITGLISQGRIGVLLSPRKLQDAWFGNFWAVAGKEVANNARTKVIPLLEGRTTGGNMVDLPTGPGIGGTVIEVGAGSGFWVEIFSDKHQRAGDEDSKTVSARTKVTKVYGVEPNPDQHANLRRRIQEASLEGIYEIVPVGIEDLDNSKKWDGKVKKGSVDCIVSILCLCSIPEPQKNMKELYGYLKKGGRWYVYEHVRADANWGMRTYQAFVNLLWPQFLGGCQLCRPTAAWLQQAGPWEKVDVRPLSSEPWYHPVPHILGVYTK